MSLVDIPLTNDARATTDALQAIAHQLKVANVIAALNYGHLGVDGKTVAWVRNELASIADGPR
jgi:hypothetical protein